MEFIYRLMGLVFKAIGLFLVIGLVAVVIARNPIIDFQPSEKFAPPIDTEELKTHVARLAGIRPARNSANVDSLYIASSYIQRVWTEQKYQVQEQSFQVDGRTYRNLSVSVGPMDAPSRIIIGAHYDVAGDQPGADDNASGVAALLTLTKLFKIEDQPKDRRIDFVAYALEEPPHFGTPNMGSVAHARSLKEAGIDVKLMISVESIGYFSTNADSQTYPHPLMSTVYPSAGNFIAVIGSMTEYGAVRRAKSIMGEYSKASIYSFNAPKRFPGVGLSDHWSFWNFGFRAIMITDTAFFRNPNYHKRSDLPETLNYPQMTEVVRGIYGIARYY